MPLFSTGCKHKEPREVGERNVEEEEEEEEEEESRAHAVSPIFVFDAFVLF